VVVIAEFYSVLMIPFRVLTVEAWWF